MKITRAKNVVLASAQHSTLKEWSRLFEELDRLDFPPVIDGRSPAGEVTEIDAYLLALKADELRCLKRHRIAIVSDADLPADVAFFIASGNNLGLTIESFSSMESALAWAGDDHESTARPDVEVQTQMTEVGSNIRPLHPAETGCENSVTVLLVDDDKQVRRIVGTNLSNAGYRVLEAAGAADALDIAERESFDLLVTDVFMPEINGLELANELRRRGCDVAMMLISGHSLEEVSRDCGQLAGSRFVSKPFLKEELLSTVQHVIADHRAARRGA